MVVLHGVSGMLLLAWCMAVAHARMVTRPAVSCLRVRWAAGPQLSERARLRCMHLLAALAEPLAEEAVSIDLNQLAVAPPACKQGR